MSPSRVINNERRSSLVMQIFHFAISRRRVIMITLRLSLKIDELASPLNTKIGWEPSRREADLHHNIYIYLFNSRDM